MRKTAYTQSQTNQAINRSCQKQKTLSHGGDLVEMLPGLRQAPQHSRLWSNWRSQICRGDFWEAFRTQRKNGVSHIFS